jgi:tRNA (mo5U34)-methyltransferase
MEALETMAIEKHTGVLRTPPQISDAEIERLVRSVRIWNHSITFGKITTPGLSSIEYQNFKAVPIPLSLEGKSVLDIGSNNGYFSFLCEQRGASRVVAIDDMLQYYGSTYGPNFPSETDTMKGFEIAKRILNSKVEFMKLSLYDVDTLKEPFDVSLFLDVYYHLNDPLGAIRKIGQFTKEVMIFAGLAILDDRPIAYLIRPLEINKEDPSNRWVASPKCLERMFELSGFSRWEMCGSIPEQAFSVPGIPSIRITYRAYK